MKTIDPTIASEISSSIKNNAIISDASFSVLAEWNMNGFFPATGINDVSGGDDLYVASVTPEDKVKVNQDPYQADQIAKPWREGNGIALWRAFSGNNSKTKLIANKATRTYAFGEKGSYSYWTAPIPSSPIASRGWKCNGEFLSVATPVASSNEFVNILGFSTDTNVIKFITNKPFPITPQAISVTSKTSTVASSFGVRVTGDFTVTGQTSGWVTTRVYRASPKNTNVLYLGSYNSTGGTSPVVIGQKIKSATIGAVTPGGVWASWTAVVTGVSELRAPNGSYWTKVSLSKPVPANVNVGQAFSIYANIVTATSAGVKQLTDTGYVPGTFAYLSFKRIQALHNIVGVLQHVSSATNSASVNSKLNTLSKLGGGAIRFTGNITLTEPIIVPSNARVKFDGTITCSPGFSSAFEYAVYFTNVSPFAKVSSAVYGNSYIDIDPATSSSVKSRITANSSLIVKALVLIEKTSNGRTIKSYSEKLYVYKVKSLSGNRITIYGTVAATVTNSSMFINSPVDVSNVVGNSYIDGGTWNLDGGTTKRAGFVRVANANGIRISRATINGASNVDTVSIVGCNNVLVRTLTIQNTLHESSSEAACVGLSSHTSRDYVDACFNVAIEACSFSGNRAVRSIVPANSETSRHKSIKIAQNTIATNTGIELSDVSHCAIKSNTITVSGDTAISISSTRAACTNNLISLNNITMGTTVGNRAVILSGTNSTRPVVYSRIIDNTISGAEASKRIQLFGTCFTQIYGNTGVTSAATVTREQAAETYYSSATVYGVRYAAPAVQYAKDKAEVVAFKQWGEKITIVLGKAVPDLRVGNYLFLTDVHESINGSRKIIGFSSDKKTVVLKSQISAITPTGTSSEFNQLKQSDNRGFAFVANPVPVNKIVVKFETSYGTPNSCFIQVKNNSIWETVYSMSSSSELSNESELDLVQSDNIKTLTIYRDTAGVWTRTKSSFDIETFPNITSVDAIRVVIGSTTTNGASPSVVEISGRLQADLTKYVMSWSTDNELDSTDRFAPIGIAVTGGGNIDLDNSTHIFDKYNKASPFYGLFTERSIFHIYSHFADNTVKVATMLSDTWSDESVSLIDKSYILQSQKARDMFLYAGWNNKSISVKAAVSGILDSIGFGNYKFYGSDGFGQMKFSYTKEEDSPWDVLREIAQAHQFGLFFDRLGQLQVLSRKHLYNRSGSDYTITGDNLMSKMIGRTDYSGYGGAGAHNSFSVRHNQPLPHDAVLSDTDSLAVAIKKEPEFYIHDVTQSGTSVTMRLLKTDTSLSLDAGNSSFYVSEMGEPLDGFFTLNSGPTISGDFYTINYTALAPAAIPVNNDYPGKVGYADNSQIAFLATGLTAGKLYEYTGYLFIPTTNTAGYSVTPKAFGATEEYGDYQNTIRDESTKFSLKFVASASEQYIGFTINNANSDDELIVYHDNVLYVDDGLEDGYDEVISGQTETLVPASKVIVSYKSANQYKESTTQLGGLLELGKNSTLWEMPDLIIPSLSVNILNWTTFKFSVEAGGYSSSSVSVGDSINMAGSPKDLDYLGIPFKGQFFLKGKYMEYLGVEASAPYATPPKLQIVTSLDDLLSIREANKNIAPKWTGKGYFAWSYPPPDIHYPGADIKLKVASAPTVAQVPTLGVSPSVTLSGAIVRPGRDAVSMVWQPRLSSIGVIGSSFQTNTKNVASGSVALFIVGSRYKHTVGLSWSQNGPLGLYGASVAVSGAQAKTKPMWISKKTYSPMPVSKLNSNSLEIRITSTRVNTTFDLYLGQYFVGSLVTGLVLDDIGTGTKVGIVMSAGVSGAVKRLYVIEAAPKLVPPKGSHEVYLFGVEQEGLAMDRVEF